MSSTNLRLPDYKSALSPYVRKLLLENTISDGEDTKVLNKHGIIDFSYICSKLEAEPKAETATSYFSESVTVLAPMLNHVEKALSDKKLIQPKNYLDFLQWTGNVELFEELFGLLLENRPVCDLVVLLVGAAALERALGDLYFMRGSPPCLTMLKDLLVTKELLEFLGPDILYLLRGSPPCPSMLKDLLVTKELLECLGPDIIQVLRILIGPPISLNLRNVVWHGFPSPEEIPKRCIYFILWLVPSIGYTLDTHKVPVLDLKHRGTVLFPKFTLQDTMEQGRQLDHIQQYITQANLLSKMFKRSRFVHEGTCKSDLWQTVTEFYCHKRYSFCAALLLYYLEQGLRRVFVTANNCPDRALTAESTTLYTTFDEILDDTVPGQQDNRLIEVLGEPLMELIFDLLVHQNGPRVRDRLSHGEADWKTFPVELTDQLMLVVIYLTKLFASENTESISEIEKETIKYVDTYISDYQDQFHRISIIKQKLRNLYFGTSSFDSHNHLTLDLLSREKDYILPPSEQHMQLCVSVKQVVNLVLKQWNISTEDQLLQCITESHSRSNSHSVVIDLLRTKIQTIHRSRIWKKSRIGTESCGNRESEVLGLLYHIVTECITIIDRMKQTMASRHNQLQAKQLRSRQRDNFKKLLSCYPSYLASLNLTAFIVLWQLYHLEKLGDENENVHKNKIRFWKQLLKFCENTRTFSHPDKNKWSDGLDLILSQTEKIKQICETTLFTYS